jgi:hypothetical protein
VSLFGAIKRSVHSIGTLGRAFTSGPTWSSSSLRFAPGEWSALPKIEISDFVKQLGGATRTVAAAGIPGAGDPREQQYHPPLTGYETYTGVIPSDSLLLQGGLSNRTLTSSLWHNLTDQRGAGAWMCWLNRPYTEGSREDPRGTLVPRFDTDRRRPIINKLRRQGAL